MTSQVTVASYPGTTSDGKDLEVLVTVYERTGENSLRILEQIRLKRNEKYNGNVYPPKLIMVEEVPAV